MVRARISLVHPLCTSLLVSYRLRGQSVYFFTTSPRRLYAGGAQFRTSRRDAHNRTQRSVSVFFFVLHHLDMFHKIEFSGQDPSSSPSLRAMAGSPSSVGPVEFGPTIRCRNTRGTKMYYCTTGLDAGLDYWIDPIFHHRPSRSRKGPTPAERRRRSTVGVTLVR